MGIASELCKRFWIDPLKGIIEHEQYQALSHMKQSVEGTPLSTFFALSESTILLYRYPTYTTMRLRYEEVDNLTIGTAWLTLGEPVFETMYIGQEVDSAISTVEKIPRPYAFHISQICEMLRIDGTPLTLDIMHIPKNTNKGIEFMHDVQLFGYGRL